MSLFEGIHLSDSLWWTVVTVTTVGYGDISPSSLGGRATAVLLMVTGIGVVSYATEHIAAFFIDEDASSGEQEEPSVTSSEAEDIQSRLDRIETILAQQVNGAHAPNRR